ncbi:MAG: hypothetical protein KAI35_05780, partial [Desulfobulbaceae bacterium]|nr:hypothetical protein [Desulfobulbaceae bacterium]
MKNGKFYTRIIGELLQKTNRWLTWYCYFLYSLILEEILGNQQTNKPTNHPTRSDLMDNLTRPGILSVDDNPF